MRPLDFTQDLLIQKKKAMMTMNSDKELKNYTIISNNHNHNNSNSDN